jgi:tocopherol O-methyltransferase
MIVCSDVNKQDIRGHYEIATPFYRLIWGHHIHHGLWNDPESAESAALAQRRLVDAVSDVARIESGQRILDVGCGMGGSAIQLVRTRGCHVTGITVSRLQQRWASWAARWHGARQGTEFLCLDAEDAAWPAGSFDGLWTIECTEHLFDKPRFFRRAAQWLRPGGRIAVCAWLAGDVVPGTEAERLVRGICRGCLCPSLGTMADYGRWLQDAGLELETTLDWTDRVARTWDICLRRVRRTGLRHLARAVDRRLVSFLDSMPALREAYRSGAMYYGCLVARRSPSTRPENVGGTGGVS